ncbi:MAG: DNA primase [Treponema sp.]|nr:DNA primase [Treponema sp.]
MGRIKQASIQEVYQRLDAVAAVEDYVRLEKRGGRYWGRCPFHAGGNERTPSFTVDPDRKLYYCFGCQKGGSVFDFVMDMDKIGFADTIKSLARKFGVELDYEEGGEGDDRDFEAEKSRREQINELYRRTAVTFRHFLMEKGEGKPALDYLLSRNVSREMIERFQLGWSPADRDWLYGFLQGKGYSPEFLDGSALFSANHRGSAFFSGRLMFPIRDRQGNTVAFGGRAMPGTLQNDGKEPPKYINTRETETYKKSQVLYALDLALPEIRRTKTVYIAEGYMDVIALHQAGITNAVAPCGTAFTGEQAQLLHRWAEKAVLIFDSDEAGQKAAVKGIVTCRINGIACSLIAPENAENGDKLKDPADILQKFGADTLKKSIKCVKFDFEYLIARAKTLYDVSIPKGKAEAIAMLYPYFDALDSKTERDDCIGAAADEMRLDKNVVHSEYELWKRSGGSSARRDAPKKPNREEVPDSDRAIRMSDELFLLTVVSVNTDLYPEFRASIEMQEIEDPNARELFIALEECYTHEESGSDHLLSRINMENLRNFIIERGLSAEFRGDSKRDPKKLMEDGINRVKEKRLRRERAGIVSRLRLLERSTGTAGSALPPDADGEMNDLIAEMMHIDAELRKLEG